ncbi:MAG: hypothetical protein AAFZ52_06110, partial [Bacteroidota bacterium]
EEDRFSPNTVLWEIQVPKANSQSPLIIRFPAMLDRLSLLQRLQLTDENKQRISGQIEITEQETEWRFVPNEKWAAGNYMLHVHGRLADPCGNNLNGLFDHKIGSLKYDQEGRIKTINLILKQ